MIEQVYYFVISIIGWAAWHKKKEEQPGKILRTSWSTMKGIILALIITMVSTCALSFCISNFHKWLPDIFMEEASFPVLDALTTVMSFVAMYLTTIRKNEGWVYWIIVDVIAIWLYWIKDVRFISIQYIILLGMAIYGFVNWIKSSK
jgi:nicotinamide mononucleotide transporter